MRSGIPAVLALFVAGALAHESGCVGCGYKGRRLECSSSGCVADMEMQMVESMMDVTDQLCRNCGTAMSPVALGCCSRRRVLRDDGMSAAGSRVSCRRYLSDGGSMEGLQCENAMESDVLADAVCHRYVSPDGVRLQEVQCEGLTMEGSQSPEIVKCARDSEGHFVHCAGSRSMMRCERSLAGMSDAAMQEAVDCRRMIEVEEAAGGGVNRMLSSMMMSGGMMDSRRSMGVSESFGMSGSSMDSRVSYRGTDGMMGGTYGSGRMVSNMDAMGRSGSMRTDSMRRNMAENSGMHDVAMGVFNRRMLSDSGMDRRRDVLSSSRTASDVVGNMGSHSSVPTHSSMSTQSVSGMRRALSKGMMDQASFMMGSMESGVGSKRRLSLVAPNSRPVCTSAGCGPSVATAPAVVVQRDTVTTVVRETSCPDGMSLEGSVCVGLDICPVQYTCPRGFVESNSGDCVTEAQPAVDCPENYALHRGNVCTRGTVTQASYVCDQSDYTLDPVSKVCVKELPQPPTCPPGYTMDGGSCVQKYAPQLRCGPGQTLSAVSKECVSTYTEKPILSCPEGAHEVEGQRCVVIRLDAPYCPARYTLDSATQTCVQPVSKVPGSCPPGFSRCGRGCERIEKTPAEPSCPTTDSFEIRGEVCHKETPQEPRCPAGTQKSSTVPGTCEKCVPSKPVCSEGVLQNGQCVVEVEQPSKECCAPGFKLDGSQCVREEVTAPRLSCDGECYMTHSYPAAYACPVDSDFVPHPEKPKCVRQVREVVCPPVTETPQCTADAASRGACPVQTNPCNDLFSTDTVPAEPYCPEGGVLEDGRCVAREPIVPTMSCDVGTLDEATGKCTRTTTAPLKFECPAGSTRRGKSCITQEYRPAAFVCPEGSEETAGGVCVVRSDAIPVPNKVLQLPVTYNCPPGVALSGKQCHFSTTVELPQVCPQGSQESAVGCVNTAPLVVPPPVEKPVRPNFYCATPGAQMSSHSCTITERQPAEPYCANDSFLHSNQCLRNVPQLETPCKVLTAAPRPVCDSPYAELRGCVCLEHDESPALVSCAAGFDLNSEGKCERRSEKTPICPFGTEQQGDGCVRRVEVAPTVRVINGCEVAPSKAPICYNGY